jgi:hypothetical protein
LFLCILLVYLEAPYAFFLIKRLLLIKKTILGPTFLTGFLLHGGQMENADYSCGIRPLGLPILCSLGPEYLYIRYCVFDFVQVNNNQIFLIPRSRIAVESWN